ncbi:hypothetical protein PFLU3_50540 [Pseudomonas fluorescens]|uniref:Uncharacterized protein n=1 Tax=Pseudomonas fluorescens TaxID=294 RepID=A0A0D0TAB8_PSEFL|nr:Fatty acid desaturase [Pseudomonas synxantha]KIR19074.1 hypothetical protein PFLU3_50540 [Pseudomonas fluorescens]
MANYLDLTHRREIQALTASFTVKSEWSTWLLSIKLYKNEF